MRILTLFLIAAILFSCSNSDNSELVSKKELDKYPNYEEVVEYFFNNYHKHIINKNLLGFYKKPDGYYIYSIDPEDYTHTDQQMIWSLKEHKYIALKKPYLDGKDNAKYEDCINHFKQMSSARYFSINPFYGYDGWEEDVIKLLENEQELSDTLLYSLARAYSYYSQSIIRNIFSAKAENYFQAYEKLEPEKVDKYLKYIDLTLNTYKKLTEQNPEFKTIVGNSYRKYSNEMVTAWQELLSIKEFEKAENYIVPDLYDKFMLGIAENYLNSCNDSAILISWGDNDTYPLWYIQEQNGTRTDVELIVKPFLSGGWYIDQLTDQTDLRFSIDPKKYRDKDFSIMYFFRSKQGTIELEDFIRFINSDSPNTFFEGIKALQETQIRFKIDKEKVLQNNIVDEQYAEYIVDEIYLDIKKDYMLKDELMILDLILTTNWERPISFTTPLIAKNLGLENYLRYDGFTYQLVPILTFPKSYDAGYINRSQMLKKIYEFNWKDITGDELANEDNQYTLRVVGARAIFDRLAEEMKDVLLGETIKALEVSLSHFPIKDFPIDYRITRIIELWQEIEEGPREGTAENFAQEYFKHVYNDMFDLMTENENLTDHEMHRLCYTHLVIISWIDDFARRYELSELQQTVEPVMEKYEPIINAR